MAAQTSSEAEAPNLDFDNSGNAPLQVPGIGHDVNEELDANFRFAHGIMDVMYERITVREVAMLGLMDALTDKPNWQEKIFDEAIVQKWREEASQMPLISDKTFDWCLTELRDKAKSTQPEYVITLDTASRCVKADNLVPPSLQTELMECIQPLLNQTKDWHPGSNDQVLNLVHPSLYPLVYGKSRVLLNGQVKLDDPLAASDDTMIAPYEDTLMPNNLDGDRYGDELARWSRHFQWLPCEVAFQDNTGITVKITSYINNLHPRKHPELYGVIERMIELSIPAWNLVLPTSAGGRTPIRITTRGASLDPESKPDWFSDLCSEESENGYQDDVRKVKDYLNTPDVPYLSGRERRDDDGPPEDWEDDEDWPLIRAAEWKFERMQIPVHPEPGNPHTYDDWKHGRERQFVEAGTGYGPAQGREHAHEFYNVSLETEFRKLGLQVIVKLASIELTPDKPEYAGGNWHLEGMLNEHIVATAIYYFDVDNISESRIRFRHEADVDDMEMSYEQDRHEPLCEIFGTDSMRDELAVQELGSVKTPHGRLLVFPNTLQHKVEPFRLVDTTKPGHRRFLVLWLVDPNYRILSTRNVPPQQHDWWMEKANDVERLPARVPREVQLMIEEQMKNDTMTLEEAKAYRLQLMAERTALPAAVEQAMLQYNFCEH